jgi:dTDP-4-amino-4,6-dideoxygalactose transaminase
MSTDTHLKYFDEAISNAVSVLKGGAESSSTSHGSWVTKFESSFTEISGHSHNIAVNSGTSALHGALAAFGVGPGDEVIMPAMSVVMNAYAALALGATPIFADINSDDWNMDLASIQRVISPKTKAIITVSWFGAPSNLKPILDFAREIGIFVLEDAAEALGARYQSKPSGFFADAVAFSFENKKHLTTGGEGGMISTSSEEIATKARKFSGLGYKHLTADAGRTSLASSEFQRPDYERYDMVSLNYRMSPLAAAVGLGQLEHFEEIISIRVRAGLSLVNLISTHSDFVPQGTCSTGQHSYYTAGIRYTGKFAWRDIYNEVIQQGGDGFYGCVLNPYLEPVFKGKRTDSQIWSKGLCPTAEAFQPQVMALKTDFRLDSDLERNLEAWERALKKF